MEEESDEFWQRIADEFCRHAARNGSGNSDNKDVQILESIRPWISAGKVKVTNGNQRFFDLLESRYPVGLNRIDWSGVSPHQAHEVLCAQDRQVVRPSDELLQLSNARPVIGAWLSKATTSEADSIIWIGDDCDLTLETCPAVFLECYPRLFGSGQHSYVIPLDGKWCINYTIEGQLFWGYSSDSLETGCVDLDIDRAE